VSDHLTVVKRTSTGVIGTCSCRQRQLDPQPTKALAEDWCERHKADMLRIASMLAKPLSDVKYLEMLEENSKDTRRSTTEREQWAQLAREFAPRVKGKKMSFDTGVETEPLF
jgi:hypothetical protein